MTMAFCRGCGKEIHSTAPFCPHCGAPQASSNTHSKVSWLSIVAVIVSGFLFIGSFDFHPKNHDDIVGLVILSVIGIALAGINLHQKRPGRTLSITAITLAAIGILICVGQM